MKNLLILVLLMDSTMLKAETINGVHKRNSSEAISQQTKEKVLKKQKEEKIILDDQTKKPEKIEKIERKGIKKVK